MPVWVQHRQNTSWEPATVVSQCSSNSYWIMQENGTDQPRVYENQNYAQDQMHQHQTDKAQLQPIDRIRKS